MTRRLGMVLPIFLIIGWEVAAIIVNNPFFLPKLETVIPVLLPRFQISSAREVLSKALVSIERVVFGFALAAAVAIPLGIGMGRFAVLNDFFDATLELLQPGSSSCVGASCTGLVQDRDCLYRIHHLYRGGISYPAQYDRRGTGNQEYLDRSGHHSGASERQVLTKIIVPGAAPTI